MKGDMLLHGYRDKVVGVGTCSILTNVMKMASFGYRPLEVKIEKKMDLIGPSIEPNPSVSSRLAERPYPAPIWLTNQGVEDDLNSVSPSLHMNIIPQIEQYFQGKVVYFALR